MKYHRSDIFEAERARLMGIAYRILGLAAEAEDAVQDTYIKWLTVDYTTIKSPAAWLTTVCTRRCIDLLRSAYKVRVDYIGTWLPEPIHTASDDSPEDKAELASSLSTAFLLLLERLTPKERAAYLLYEIFNTDYCDIANTLEIEEATCRKLVSRARSHIAQTKVRYSVPKESQERLLQAFQSAVDNGETRHLAKLLANDVELRTDGGGKAPSISKVLIDINHILKFIRTVISPNWANSQMVAAQINGQRGFIVSENDEIHTVVSFAFDEAATVTDIFLIRNPDKLTYVGTCEHVKLH